MKLFLIYLVLINAVGFAVMHLDKYKARKSLWRIPEASLISIALIGGSVGILTGMKTAHHKTKHLKFTLGVPFIIAIQIVLSVILISIVKGNI